MFWKCIIAAAIAVVLIKLGALSVWVSVLSVAFQVAIAVILIGAGIALWIRFNRR